MGAACPRPPVYTNPDGFALAQPGPSRYGVCCNTRRACGVFFIVRGIAYFGEKHGFAFLQSVVGLLMIAVAALLLIGFLTRLAALAGALIDLASMLPWLSSPNLDIPQVRMTTLLLVVIALALACPGPGAFSIDGRLFGHREIVIPPSSSLNSSLDN